MGDRQSSAPERVDRSCESQRRRRGLESQHTSLRAESADDVDSRRNGEHVSGHLPRILVQNSKMQATMFSLYLGCAHMDTYVGTPHCIKFIFLS